MLYVILSIALFLGWGWIFSLFPKTKTGLVVKWAFAGIVAFFFWKEMLEQGPEIIIPVAFTVIIFLALLFFPAFKNLILAGLLRIHERKN